jgi:hypothetical protein
MALSSLLLWLILSLSARSAAGRCLPRKACGRLAPRRSCPPRVEPLEDRTVPTTVTVLASHLHTAGGQPEQLRVLETGTVAYGNDLTLNVTPGLYHLTDYDGGGTYGSFTVTNDGTISGTTGAAVASGGAIDFDLTKLAAVTIFGSDLHTDGGLQQAVNVQFFVAFRQDATDSLDTVYLPACTAQVTDYFPLGVYGSFTVADDGSGALAVTGTSGAAVATDGHTIHFDRSKLAAVTIFGSDLHTDGGLQQAVNVRFFVGLPQNAHDSTDTVYFPACTVPLTNAYGDAVYGTVTVADNGSGTLAVTGTTGAAVATGNIIHFDRNRLAAVTVFQSDLQAQGPPAEVVRADGFVALDARDTSDTMYFPACTVRVTDYFGVAYGTFTVADVGSGVLAVTATTGEAIATGPYTIHFLSPGSLSGLVFEDFNDDGQVDFGERGIPGVSIRLAGTDALGNPVDRSQTTDADGAYVFLNVLPGHYSLTETQPAGYLQGIDSVGTAGGSLAAQDQFFVSMGSGVDGLNYNYGERPPAGAAVQEGQTAGIGFWNNKNGQALIHALNGGTDTQLGDWLAATLPNLFGANAGANALAGKSNAAVAALFQQDFLRKGVKLDAQVLAAALSVYVTNASLDPTAVAARYGFTVAGEGVGTATFNVRSNGDAFGVADNTTLTVLDLLLATDQQAVNGVLYNGNTTKRKEANDVYSALNEAGDI